MKCADRDYSKRITVERVAGTADAHGHVVETTEANWTEYASSFASVQTKGGREFWKVQQMSADVTHVWHCPWSKRLMQATPDMRIICEGQPHYIVSVIDIDEAHREIQIQTRRPVQ